MTKRPSILSTEHDRQFNWLTKQIKNFNLSIFLNPKLAMDAFESLNESSPGFLDNKDLEKYVERYLSEVGHKRLITTLRVAESRSKKGFSLQANISRRSNGKLNYMVGKTAMKKNELIDKLIEVADLEEIIKKIEDLKTE